MKLSFHGADRGVTGSCHMIGRADLTSALVGIAGAFIGFHIAAIVALSAGMIVLFVAAAIGAVLVLWGWREIRL